MGNPVADVLKRSNLRPGLDVFRASALVAQPIALPAEIAEAFPRLSIPAGRTIACHGSAAVSLALRLAAAGCPRGKWSAIVSSAEPTTPAINPAAARESGVALERTLWVCVGDTASAAAMCMESCAVVVVHGGINRRNVQRLQARAASAAATLIFICADDEHGVDADVTFAAADEHWDGLLAGYGHLMNRDLTLSVRARHAPPMNPAPVRLHRDSEQEPHDVPEHA